MKILKRFFCKHDYIRTGTKQYERHKGFIVPVTVYRCTKCGKVKCL